jgi:hypothetical protein
VRVVPGVVDDGFALDAFLNNSAGEVNGAVGACIGGKGSEFEGVEAAAGVAIANPGEMTGGVLVEADGFGPQSAIRIG